MGSFCSFSLVGFANSTKIIHILDSMENLCSSLQKKCKLNIKYTEHHLSLDVLLDESEEKVCSLISDKRDEMHTTFTMIFSCRNKILLREGMDLRKLVNGILEAANNFGTLEVDFLVGDTDKEASVSCADNVLSVTLNAKQHPALPSDRDPVGIFPTRVVITCEVLYNVLRRFTGELEQVVGQTLRVRGENGRLVLSIRGTELREQLDADGIRVQGQMPVQATYDLYKIWYLISMLRREHNGVLGDAEAQFMWNATEHKLSLQLIDAFITANWEEEAFFEKEIYSLNCKLGALGWGEVGPISGDPPSNDLCSAVRNCPDCTTLF